MSTGRPAGISSMTRSGPHSLSAEQREIHAKVRADLLQKGILPIEDRHKISDDDLLFRFLIAKQWKVDVAVKGLSDYVQWRRDLGVETCFFRNTPFHSDITTATTGYCGYDKEGFPLYYDRPNPEQILQMLKTQPREILIQWHLVVAELGRGLQKKCGKDRFVAVLDLQHIGIGIVKNPSVMKLMKEFAHIDQHCYPENMKVMCFINAPRSFSWTWKLVSGLLEERVKKKIKFLGKLQDLEEYVSIDNVPEEFGGRLKGGLRSIPSMIEEEEEEVVAIAKAREVPVSNRALEHRELDAVDALVVGSDCSSSQLVDERSVRETENFPRTPEPPAPAERRNDEVATKAAESIVVESDTLIPLTGPGQCNDAAVTSDETDSRQQLPEQGSNEHPTDCKPEPVVESCPAIREPVSLKHQLEPPPNVLHSSELAHVETITTTETTNVDSPLETNAATPKMVDVSEAVSERQQRVAFDEEPTVVEHSKPVSVEELPAAQQPRRSRGRQPLFTQVKPLPVAIAPSSTEHSVETRSSPAVAIKLPKASHRHDSTPAPVTMDRSYCSHEDLPLWLHYEEKSHHLKESAKMRPKPFAAHLALRTAACDGVAAEWSTVIVHVVEDLKRLTLSRVTHPMPFLMLDMTKDISQVLLCQSSTYTELDLDLVMVSRLGIIVLATPGDELRQLVDWLEATYPTLCPNLRALSSGSPSDSEDIVDRWRNAIVVV